MSESLRDQLLKAGLVSEKQARQAERESGQQKYRQGKRPKKDRAARAQSAPDPGLAAKAERDRELNRRRQQRAHLGGGELNAWFSVESGKSGRDDCTSIVCALLL